MAILTTIKKTRLYTFVANTVAKSNEVNGELNQLITELSHTVDDLTAINAEVESAQSETNTNTVAIADHETRISDNETDISALQTAQALDEAALTTHKSSSDHDSRYYTETEMDATITPMQSNISAAQAAIVNLQNTLAALDSTYSTDAERVAAIAAVIDAFELADDDLEALIVGKADASNVYTKAEIDAMTLGSYKFGNFTETGFLGVGGTYTATTVEYNAVNDMCIVSVGGLFQQLDVDYSLDTVTKTFTGESDQWVEGYQIDLFIIKNARVLVAEDYIDGTLIQNGTINRAALDAALEADIAGLESDVASKAVITKGTATLLAAGWVAGTGDYALQQDVAIAGILATDWVDALPSSQNDIDVAQDAEVASIVTEYAGGIRFYAQTATASDITIRYKVVR